MKNKHGRGTYHINHYLITLCIIQNHLLTAAIDTTLSVSIDGLLFAFIKQICTEKNHYNYRLFKGCMITYCAVNDISDDGYIQCGRCYQL